MNTFKINGKTYIAQPFTFNSMADLSEMGVNVEEIDTKPIPILRAYFALCGGFDVHKAGDEIQKHIINGGELTDLTNAIKTELENSDFFRAIFKNEEEEVTEVQKKTSKKVTKKTEEEDL